MVFVFVGLLIEKGNIDKNSSCNNIFFFGGCRGWVLGVSKSRFFIRCRRGSWLLGRILMVWVLK